MMQLWRSDQQFLSWMTALTGLVVFSILAQTYVLPYVLAVVAGVLIFCWWREAQSNFDSTTSTILVSGSLVFVVGLMGNGVVTQNLPATLHEIMKWLVGLMVFLSAVRWVPQKKNQPLVWLSSLVVLGVLGVVSLLTWIVPNLRILPDMNFLYATFGHNHFSAALIWILPWIVLGDKIWPSRMWQWAVVAWTAWLFSTFSRLGIGVAVVQFLVLRFWLRSDQVWSRFLTRWLLVLMVVAGVWFGAQVIGRNQQFCAQRSYFSLRLCKVNQSEQRPEYWRQAGEVLRHNPVFGTGLGTFAAASLQHRKAPGSYAGHVHNDYLEWIVEAGWWGLLVTLGMWGMWWCFRPRTTDWFARVVWLSTGSLLVIGLLDFDLQFVVFLFLSLMGLGWLVGLQLQQVQKNPQISQIKIFLTLCAAIVMGWAVMFLMLDLDRQYGSKQQFYRYGQYYPAYSFLLIEHWRSLNAERQAELVQFWWQDFRVLEHLFDAHGASFDLQTQIAFFKHFYELNPWSRQKYDLAKLQFRINDLAGARQTLRDTSDFEKQLQEKFGVSFRAEGDQLRWRQAQQYRTLAELELSRDDGLAAVEALYIAAQFEPWIMDDPSLGYCVGLKHWVRSHPNDHLDWLEKWSSQLELFDKLNPVYFGSCAKDLSLIALEQLQVQLNYSRCFGEVCSLWRQRALRWSQNDLWVIEYLAKLHMQFPTQQF